MKEEFTKKLTEEQKEILIDKGTEKAFTGKLLHNKEKGTYSCVICKNELFSSDMKFDSGTGWPSFYEVINEKNIKVEEDNSFGMKRDEVLCSKCGGHLGHVFSNGNGSRGKRYCINSVALNFKKN